ncbi:putative F-box protein At1g47790 [Rutidosis leptorrhynchoides]|uniref:putative F-box protein At1g47790 n=1 Tax=Rutidosis leptorrhynchoides TaxID=125765 RepID=UPI003A994AA9
MSDHIPFDLQIAIMLWLPIKSLYRFKSVSKTWKFLIASPKFIADYTKLHSHRQHLLIQYNHPLYYHQNCFISIVDDDTFPEHKRFLTTPDSLSLDKLALVGSSHGLFYFVGRRDTTITLKVVVIWNPSINKSVVVPLHNVKKDGEHYKDFFFLLSGFVQTDMTRR